MKRSILIYILCAVCCLPVWAQDSARIAKRETVKSHLKQHFKPYGFIRNYFAYDSRESMSGTGDLYNYQPKDENWNVKTQEEADQLGVERQDLNAISTFRFLTLTTRVGLNIVGYKWRNTEFGGKIEADFYAGLSTKGSGTHSVSGTAQLRLRQAYMTLAWDSLRMNDKDFARVDLLLGQAWHPMAADLCDAIALNSGAPFGPFSRTPQVKMDARLGHLFTLTGALIWQMQYCSIGPDGQSAEYIGYSKTPEAYLGLSFHHKGWLVRAGADVLSIKPRHIGAALGSDGNLIKGSDGKDLAIKVSDRLTTVSPFVYLQYKNLMYFIIASYISSRYDTEDVLSESFIKVVEHRHEVKNPKSFKSYVASIAKNQALDFLRKQREIPSSDIIDEIYEEEDKTNELLSTFEPLLTNKETIVTYLKIGFSYTWNEIVAETGISESTARRLYESAKGKLRKELR